jgi:hypothetical protein
VSTPPIVGTTSSLRLWFEGKMVLASVSSACISGVFDWA